MQKLARTKRAGLECFGLEPLLVVGVQSCASDSGVRPARERRKRNRGRTALLALKAELGSSKNCARTMELESRRKRRKFTIMLFAKNVGVKENRETLLCKKSSGIQKTATYQRGATASSLKTGGGPPRLERWITFKKGLACGS
jgi:hypothetical protein